MKKINLIIGESRIESNYMKSNPLYLGELMDGLFKDASRPLLMDVDILLRPITISSKSRNDRQLPDFIIKTFDKNMELVRSIDYVRKEIKVPMTVIERFILEIPKNLNIDYALLNNMTRLKFDFA